MSADKDERIVAMQMTITHLQNDLEQLSQVVVEQQSQLDSLQAKTDALENGFEQIRSESEKRDPAQERPPHY